MTIENLAPLQKILISRAEKAGITVSEGESIGELLARVDLAGSGQIVSDRTFAKAHDRIRRSFDSVDEALRAGVPAFWSSSAKVDDTFGAPKLLGYHAGIASSMYAGRLINQHMLLDAEAPVGASDEMVASNLLRMMLLGHLTPFRLAKNPLKPHLASTLAAQEMQYAIADELLNQTGGLQLLGSPENLLTVAVMLSMVGADSVVEALQEHPLAAPMFEPGMVRDKALSSIVGQSFDLDDVAHVRFLHTHAGHFLGLDPLDFDWDAAFGTSCRSPTNERLQAIIKTFLHDRLDTLMGADLEHFASAWLPVVSGFSLSEQIPDAHMPAFWGALSRQPEYLKDSFHFFYKTKDPAFLQASIVTLGEASWVELFSTSHGALADRFRRLDVFAQLDIPTVSRHPEVRQFFLKTMRWEMLGEDGALDFMQRDDLKGVWSKMLETATDLCAKVGTLLSLSYTREEGLEWVTLLKHKEHQDAFISKLPRDPVLLAYLDDEGLEAALADDLGL